MEAIGPEKATIEIKDKLIEALISMLHSSLSHAINKLSDQYDKEIMDVMIKECLPISLSRFAYEEMLLLTMIAPNSITMEKAESLFISLFKYWFAKHHGGSNKANNG
jgi:hypothetical protein